VTVFDTVIGGLGSSMLNMLRALVREYRRSGDVRRRIKDHRFFLARDE